MYEHEGKAINNFDKLLPDVGSDLARKITKNPYHFDFLTLQEECDEKEYIAAADGILRGESDNPTIGLLICKTKDNVLARYATRAINVPVGSASFKKYDDECAEVKRVFSKQEYRGRGISKKLMELLEDAARKKGYRYLILESGEPLVAAMALYRKIVYEVILK